MRAESSRDLGILRPFETAFVCKIAAEEAETMEVSQLVELKAL